MKGIVLAGGLGTRLKPITESVSKHLLPIYDKPMIYYPLSVLMLADIREILLISTPRDLKLYEESLGDGKRFGLSISYAQQNNPGGIAQSFLIGDKFIGKSKVCLILGDNIFYGQHLSEKLVSSKGLDEGAIIFGYHVNNPEEFGVISLDKKGNPLNIEEKPKSPKSNFAVTGLYFYDNKVIDISKKLKPSARGELEISDINREYLKLDQLKVEILGRGFAWLDTGTTDSLLGAGNFIQTVQLRQGLKIACLEEIAWSKGWINDEELLESIEVSGKNEYSSYLKGLLTL